MYTGVHVKYPLFLSEVNKTWIFSTYFRKIFEHLFVRIRPLEAKVFHADRPTDGQTERQTDMTKLIVAFRSFAKASKSVCFDVPNNIYYWCTNSGRQVALATKFYTVALFVDGVVDGIHITKTWKVFEEAFDIFELYIYIRIIEANKMKYFSTLFWHKFYIFRTDFLSVIRIRDTLFTASRQSTQMVWQIPAAVNTVPRLLMMDRKSVRNM